MSRRCLAILTAIPCALSLFTPVARSQDASEGATGLPRPVLLQAVRPAHIEPVLGGLQSVADMSGKEIVRERFPNGRLRIERAVVLDEDQNYINDGIWKMWDTAGNLLVEGTYAGGQRQGIWNRWYRDRDIQLLRSPPYQSFSGPFLSQAKFQQGKLHGAWTIYDGQQRKISQIQFDQGRRHGTAIWWSPKGHKLQEANFQQGLLRGELSIWNNEGALVSAEKYEAGRRLEKQVQYYAPERKRWEGQLLHPQIVVSSPDQWWTGKLATFTSQGPQQRHGSWFTWYSDGQLRFQGRYDYGMPVGTFIWWYPNGQRRSEGAYADGKQQGPWTWWYRNGQKQAHGDFLNGSRIGPWIWWAENGTSTQSIDFALRSHTGQGSGAQVNSVLKPSPPPGD